MQWQIGNATCIVGCGGSICIAAAEISTFCVHISLFHQRSHRQVAHHLYHDAHRDNEVFRLMGVEGGT